MANDLVSFIEAQMPQQPADDSSSEPESSNAPSAGRNAGSRDQNLSKSERIRRYLGRHPEARNRDVVDALDRYGVTAGDVSNVKRQLRNKAEESPAPARPAAAAASSPSPSPVADESTPEVDASIRLDVLDAGIEFVRKAGGYNEAQYVLSVIRRIQSL